MDQARRRIVEKAAEIVAAPGRVIEVADARSFSVKGKTGTYLVTLVTDGGWCTCPGSGMCSHLLAVRHLTTTTTPADPFAGLGGNR